LRRHRSWSCRWRTAEERAAVEAAIVPVEARLRTQVVFGDQCIRVVRVAWRDDLTPGYKFNDWERRGVPIRLEVGPRDVAAGTIVVAERVPATDDTGAKESVSVDHLPADVAARLERMQQHLLEWAITFQRTTTDQVSASDHFVAVNAAEGGFLVAGWSPRPPANARSRPRPGPPCASCRSRASSRGSNTRPPAPAVARRLRRRRCSLALTDRR